MSENFKLKEEEINENKFFIKYEYINLEIEEPKVGSITYLSNNENLKTLYIPSSKIYLSLNQTIQFSFYKIIQKIKMNNLIY